MPLDVSLAELAARMGVETKLAMADAMIYAATEAHLAMRIHAFFGTGLGDSDLKFARLDRALQRR